jgi:glycine/serine hydroxymethyltransferase
VYIKSLFTILLGHIIMFKKADTLSHIDPELSSAIQHEWIRQEEHLELIASEN